MQPDAIDRIIKNAIEVMESSKYQIFEICETARQEREALTRELQEVMEETSKTIDRVDKLEIEYKRSRVRLTEVSRDFHRFREEDIKVAYEAATSMQTQLAAARERGVAEIQVPREVMVVDKVPLLGTGKIDYPAVQRMVGTRPEREEVAA